MAATDPFFRQTLAFNHTTDIGPNSPPALKELISSFPDLKIYTRSSPHFQSLKGVWNLQYSDVSPLALIRATSSAEVSAVIKYCKANDLPLAIRSGGHDLSGRSVIQDAIILDIRELNQIVLAEDRKSVTIGGGTQTGPLVDLLASHGLVTVCSLAGIVGHIGWAFNGGCGPLANTFGLGVDQITAAKIVTATGEELEADSELLWGIKGAGGAFGVLTEVTLKIYELPTMLGGMIIFKFDGAEKILADIQSIADSEETPGPLGIGMHMSKREGNPMLAISFTWASTDFEEGNKWLSKVRGLGTVMMDTVSETSMKKWSDMMALMLPPPSYSNSRAFYMDKFNPSNISILTSAANKIPDGSKFGIGGFLLFSNHVVKARPDSSFQMREQCSFIHALAPVSEPSHVSEAKEWTVNVFKELKEAGSVKRNYLAILDLDVEVKECFEAESLERLKLLKKKYDAENVFKHTAAQLL